MNPQRLDVGEYTTVALCRNGWTLYNRNDVFVGNCLYRYGQYSYDEQRLFEHFIGPNDIVIEAGAHIGSLTVPISKVAGTVYAFEPQRLAFQMLCANLALGECRNVYAYPIAIGAENGMIMVPKEKPEVLGNMGGVILKGVTEGERVQLVTIDSLGIDCNFLKADVEEMEFDVLTGAKATIRRCRPIMYLECNKNHEPLIELLTELEYAAHWHLPMMFNEDNFYENADNAMANTASTNLLCFPLEHPAANDFQRARITLDNIGIT